MNTITKIEKTMTIAQILELVPASVTLMEQLGLQCVGCSANMFETLEEGMLGHGFTDEDVNQLSNAINELYQQIKELETNSPTEADMKADKTAEGYKIAGVLMTENAFSALHELRAGKKGLAIAIEPGGCSGFKTFYDFADEPVGEQKTYTLSEDFSLFIDDFTFNKLYGSHVDFKSGLHGSGLTFSNPNAKKSCGCGKSMGF